MEKGPGMDVDVERAGSSEASRPSSSIQPHDCSAEKLPVHGYPKLASLIGTDGSFAIFRRFDDLNAKNLLYLQAELADLEYRLRELEVANSTNPECEGLQTYVYELMRPTPEGPNEQWKLVLQIREKIYRYNKLLLQHEQLYRLPAPSRFDKEALRTWLEHEKYGRGFLEIPECCAFNRNPDDLVALSTHQLDSDPFTKWFMHKLMPLYLRFFSWGVRKQLEDGLFICKDKSINRIAKNITIVISSLLPTASIFALYYITSPVIRLAFIMAFSALFTICLAIFTSASRVEIFAAAVALASVQVVFIGTNGSVP